MEYLSTMSKGIMVFLHGQATCQELVSFFLLITYAHFPTTYWIVYLAIYHALQHSVWLHTWLLNPFGL